LPSQIVNIDINRNSIVLAWVVIKNKNKNNDSWRYFFKHLIALILKIKEEGLCLSAIMVKVLKLLTTSLKIMLLRRFILII
jgi:hypothetical protein